ncbi:MAG TPA: DUF4349 domain-containing protein [Puia sp.]
MKTLNVITQLALVIIFCLSCNIRSKNDIKEIQLPKSIGNKTNELAALADSTVSGNYQNEPEQNKPSPEKKPSTDKTLQKTDWDKKIIKTADLNVEVKNYTSFNDRIHKNIKELGGYVSKEEQNESDYKIENIISIKVPVDQFDNAISELITNNEKIIEKKITSDDVTTEIVDTKSRIEAKKQVRLRYLDLLKQARNMDEILQVQNEINDIQEQLESAAGRIEYLNHSSAFSTINLTFYQILNSSTPNEKEPSYLHQVTEAFKEGLKWVGSLIVALISLWPLWTGVIIIWIILRKIRISKIKILS